MNLIRNKKYGMIGFGKMSQALTKSLLEAGSISKDSMYVTNRSEKKIEKARETFGVNTCANNEELVDVCDVIFLCVKPQDLLDVLQSLAHQFREDQIIISLAAGISLKTLKKFLPNSKRIFRIMPNTAIRMNKGVIGYCSTQEAEALHESIEDLLSPLGLVVKAEEGDQFEALTVSCSSGVGFLYELMMYWQDWLEEHGFEPQVAKAMTIQTFLGSSMVAAHQSTTQLMHLQDEVVSKKGVTGAGLDSMRELEIERLLRYSFEKAALRDQELGKTLV